MTRLVRLLTLSTLIGAACISACSSSAMQSSARFSAAATTCKVPETLVEHGSQMHLSAGKYGAGKAFCLIQTLHGPLSASQGLLEASRTPMTPWSSSWDDVTMTATPQSGSLDVLFVDQQVP